MRNNSSNSLTREALDELAKLSANIKIARRRRAITLAQLSVRTGVSTSTLSRLERADPTVSIGALLQVLSILNIAAGISKFASPENDIESILSEAKALRSKTVL